MSRERTRALQTFKQVEAVRERCPDHEQKRYASLAYSLPVLLRTAGLAQCVAFLVSRDCSEAKLFLRHLGERLGLPTDPVGLFEAVSTENTTKYLAMTAEALSCSDWYVRHVQAVLKVDRTTAQESAE